MSDNPAKSLRKWCRLFMMPGPWLPVLVLLAGLLMVQGGVSPAFGQTAGDQVGEIVEVVGATQIIRDGTALPVRIGLALREQDRLTTDGGGRLTIRFADGSIVRVGGFSDMTIREYRRPAGGDGILDLIRGLARAIVGDARDGGGFRIETTTAVASVRGTDWMIEAEPGLTAVFVSEGEVSVSGDGESVVLETGEGTDVARGAGPTPPASWPPDRIADLLARLGN